MGRERAPAVALCHEWLARRSGSEKTFEAMADALPTADLYALTRDPLVEFTFADRPVRTTFMDRMGRLGSKRELQLPLMPLAWRLASADTYDLVVTSSHACVKGFFPGRAALHLCYCYTPMRYVWLSGIDRRKRGSVVSEAGKRILRRWDRSSVAWVDHFAAISTEVARRIENFYGRSAAVIFPPVATDFYTPDPAGTPRSEQALTVSRMVPYKRLDLAIEACHRAGVPLTVAGSGPDEARLRDQAARLGAAVSFVVDPTDVELRTLYRSALTVVFPAEEDFGIVAVEAQACGTPVVALARAGSLDTVVDGVTGVLVDEHDPAAFAAAVQRAAGGGLDPVACRAHAEGFATERFGRQFLDWVVAAAAGRGIDLGATA